MFVTAGMTVRAQPDTNVVSKMPRTPTQIDSASGFFDGNGHKAVYCGNVRVSDPEMKLTCAWLVVDLPQSGGRVSHIVAQTNVVIDATDSKGQTMHATSDKAIYSFQVKDSVTNETVTLTGNAKVENAQGWLTGEPIVWNRANDSVTATDQHMIFKQSLNGMPAGTNAPPVTTNKLTAPKSNLPPGTIDNIDKMILPRQGGQGGF